MIQLSGLAVDRLTGLKQRFPALETLVGAALVATLLALAFDNVLTNRESRIGPDGSGKTYDAYLYSDEGNGGTSRATADESRPLSWTCQLTRTYNYGYCGFGLLFDRQHTGRGMDLRPFEKILLEVNYSGPGELLRVSLKNQNPKYRFPDGSPTDKVSQTSVAVRQGKQLLELDLRDFDVPEWWQDQMKVATEEAQPEFDNVVSLEVLTGVDSAVGEHRIQIDEIRATGRSVPAELWYGSIGACWFLLVAILLFHRRAQREAMKRQLAGSWRKTLNTIPQMVCWVDEHGPHYNGRWAEFTGVPVEGSKADFYSLVHPDDRQAVMLSWQESSDNASPLEMELRLQHNSGEYRWVLARAVPAQGEDGSVTGWYATCTDVHDRVLAQEALRASIRSERENAERLKWVSEHDALTGLPNRRAFQDRLQAACDKASNTGTQVGLFLIDLDHFKHVNDTLGHAAGDHLLKTMSERLTPSVRQEHFVARVGGDEFALIVENAGSDEAMLAIGKRLFDKMRAPIRHDRRVVSSGASIGGAVFPRDATNASDLFKAADTALYALKASGRGGTKLFNPEMMEEAERAASQLNLARIAVSEETALPHYQAKFEITTGAVAGFEALLRWKQAQLGLHLPGELAEAFNDYELAAKIGDLMQRKVCRDISQWTRRGLSFGRISVNASPAEFLRDDYAERLLAVLAQENVPAEALEVEITEHAFMGRGAHYVASALGRLQEAGVRIALDDFGTGHSSLSHLRDFPVDVVKIDQSFVQQMLLSREMASIVGAVVNLARSLNIEVVAEGVEKPEQLELLRAIGCHYAQGNLLGEPCDADAVAESLASSKAAA